MVIVYETLTGDNLVATIWNGFIINLAYLFLILNLLFFVELLLFLLLPGLDDLLDELELLLGV